MAIALQEGEGTEKDNEKGMKLLSQMSEKGDGAATYNIAFTFEGDVSLHILNIRGTDF